MNLNIETIFHSIEDYYNQFIILFEMLTLSDESNGIAREMVRHTEEEDGGGGGKTCSGKMMNNRP